MDFTESNMPRTETVLKPASDIWIEEALAQAVEFHEDKRRYFNEKITKLAVLLEEVRSLIKKIFSEQEQTGLLNALEASFGGSAEEALTSPEVDLESQVESMSQHLNVLKLRILESGRGISISKIN